MTQTKKKQSTSQQGFAIAMVVLAAICIPYAYFCFSLYFKARALRPDYDWPALSELWKAAVSGVVFIAVKHAVVSLTYSLNKPLCKN